MYVVLRHTEACQHVEPDITTQSMPFCQVTILNKKLLRLASKYRRMGVSTTVDGCVLWVTVKC
jgi:hypothetical protein